MSATIGIGIVCNTCVTELDGGWDETRNRLIVEPCPRCIQKAEEKGDEKGYDRGLLEGNEEGFKRGIHAGQQSVTI